MNEITTTANGRHSCIERAFNLPFGYCATFIWRCPCGPLEVCWSPDQPCIRKPRPQRKFLAAYQAARREFFEELGVVVGGTILIVDTDLKTVCGHEVILPPTQH
jgi:8-oxo-dGTP pyrophosphatase MutT (NUDIX family)